MDCFVAKPPRNDARSLIDAQAPLPTGEGLGVGCIINTPPPAIPSHHLRPTMPTHPRHALPAYIFGLFAEAFRRAFRWAVRTLLRK